jgi:hypothetical protein
MEYHDCKIDLIDGLSIKKKILQYLPDSKTYLINQIFIEYEKEYNSNFEYEDISFIFEKNEDFIISPLTKSYKDSFCYLNYYGRPINFFYSVKKDVSIVNNFNNYFYDFIKKNRFNNIKVITENNSFLNNFFGNDDIKSIYEETIIDLTLPLEKIYSQLNKSHRWNINKGRRQLNYSIYNYKNYPDNEIFKMKDMHKNVSGRQTRSDLSWAICEKMIKNNNGFLIETKLQDLPISYSFFFYDENSCAFFSSCALRDYFKYSVNHFSIWNTIVYCKNLGIKSFFLGRSKTLYINENRDEKENSIEEFKNLFGGIKKKIYEYNKIIQ